MNTETGEILNPDQMEFLRQTTEYDPEKMEKLKKFKEMKLPPTPRQLRKKKIGRNEPCPCGSGKKFKKCCLK